MLFYFSVIFAALAAALSSLFLRKNSSHDNPRGYLLPFYGLSLVLSFTLFPETFHEPINIPILTLGIVVGLLNSCLMALTARTIKLGPSALTFAFLNASAVFPGILLYLFLGASHGYHISSTQLIGFTCIIAGLFVGGLSESKATSRKWLSAALACFAIQVLALTTIQCRCLFFSCTESNSFLAHFTAPTTADVWFMPGQFGAAFLLQILLLFKNPRSSFSKHSLFYGSMGSLANFFSTLLLLIATKCALPHQTSLLFPLFAIAAMILCNLWAIYFYREKFNYKTNTLCSLGILLSSV